MLHPRTSHVPAYNCLIDAALTKNHFRQLAGSKGNAEDIFRAGGHCVQSLLVSSLNSLAYE